jgi:hypothetical protein
MKFSFSAAVLGAVACLSVSSNVVNGFTSPSPILRPSALAMASPSMAESGIPPAKSAATEMEDIEIPTFLPSDCGMDYIPLATMLATGELAEADQFTRDALIVISGAKAAGRDFVYFTDVKRIPNTDLATIERLWNKFSGGKFGYSVQKVRLLSVGEMYVCMYPLCDSYAKQFLLFRNLAMLQKKMKQSKDNFETFCRKIGWTQKDGDLERKKRWFGASEFVYDVKKAAEGHLPLTSALRGTSLIKNLLTHPVWDNDDWMTEPERK